MLTHPDGTKIRIGLVDRSKVVKDKRHLAPKQNGFLELRYRNEVYSVYKSRGSHEAQLREFGIWHSRVAADVGMVIEPPIARTGREKFAIEQDKTRSFIHVVPGGSALADSGKYREWADYVADNLPTFVKDALEVAASKDKPAKREREVAKHVMSIIKAHAAAVLLTGSRKGKESGTETEETKRRRGEGSGMVKDDEGDTPGVGGEDAAPHENNGGGGGGGKGRTVDENPEG